SPATRKPYTKAEDVAVLPAIRRLVDQRPTYGYRRITALLNRERRAQDLPSVNAKRVLRIMQANGLVLTRHTAYRPARTHDGVSGEMVRDLMVEAVEKRFGGTRTPHPVEWLSDNGSAYIARET